MGPLMKAFVTRVGGDRWAKGGLRERATKTQRRGLERPQRGEKVANFYLSLMLMFRESKRVNADDPFGDTRDLGTDEPSHLTV